MTNVRIGLLGAARITPGALVEPAGVMPQVSLTGIAARRKRKARAFASRHKVETVYSSYADLIASPDIDLIYNPLPINLHAEWSIKALEAGKHVLCEKPFAMNSGEADAMLAAAQKTGKRLIEAFHYRYHPSFETCLEWIKAGKIGEVRKIDAVFNVGIKDDGKEIRHRVETGGGAMMDLGCYPLNWALAVMDATPEQIDARATLTPAGVDESMQAELQFSTGAIARLSSSMALGEPFHATMKVTGGEGEIHFTNPLAPHHGGSLNLIKNSAVLERAAISPITTYTYQLATVSSALASDAPLPTEGGVILRQQEALDGIYAVAGLGHLRER